METKFTLTEFAEIMAKNKWHLLRIESEVERVDYGIIEVRLDVRAGIVEKVTLKSEKNELRPKEGHREEVLTGNIFGVNIKL